MQLFRHLYPDCIEKTGHPTSLNVSNTRLTIYNGTWIPLFGSLQGPIIWQPGSPHAQPCQINSCWYVADTPGPVILGFPSCKILKVVKMNCAVKSSTSWQNGFLIMGHQKSYTQIMAHSLLVLPFSLPWGFGLGWGLGELGVS